MVSPVFTDNDNLPVTFDALMVRMIKFKPPSIHESILHHEEKNDVLLFNLTKLVLERIELI
jgi:hypothetical protein